MEPVLTGVCLLCLAISLVLPTFLFRGDFCKCSDSHEYTLTLMIFMVIPYESWNDYYHLSLN